MQGNAYLMAEPRPKGIIHTKAAVLRLPKNEMHFCILSQTLMPRNKIWGNFNLALPDR